MKSDPLSFDKQCEVVDGPQRSKDVNIPMFMTFPTMSSGKTVSFRGISMTF